MKDLKGCCLINIREWFIVVGVALFLAGVLHPSDLKAEDVIKARYSRPRGNHIVWKIKVPSPAPAAVIVTQYILPGSQISEPSHPVSSYDQEKGVAKWLLTGIESGTLKMEMRVDQPIRKKGEIHGEITFKDINSNTIASALMEPRAKKKAIEGC